MSAVPVAVMVMVGWVPPPVVTGVVQVLCWVWSAAVVVVRRVQVLPAVSVTDLAVALPPLQMPTWAIRRSPVVRAWGGVRVMVAALARPDVCCTNAGPTTGLGVTAVLAADVCPVPTALVAETVNV